MLKRSRLSSLFLPVNGLTVSDERAMRGLVGKRGDIIALLAGAILPLAFAPFHYGVLAVVSLALLFACWIEVSARRIFWRGALFGIGMFGVGVSWVHVSIYEYGGVSLGLSLFLTALFVVVLALFPAIMAWLGAKYRERSAPWSPAVTLLLLFPSLWTLSEWVRGWFLTGFPWLSVGYSQLESPLAGFAPLAGVYGVSWFTAFSAGAIVLLASVIRHNRGQALSLAVGMSGLWVAGFLFKQIEWSRPAGPPINVALIQGNISQELKWLQDVRDPTIRLYKGLTEQNWESDLIIWPETALPGFYHREQELLAALGEEARAHKADILLGVLSLDETTGHYYNSVVSVGEQETFYHKHHLVPFTEYLPLKGLLGGLVDFMQVPMSDFTAGDPYQPLIQAAGYKIGVSICFEDAFGEEAIRSLPEAALLVNVSNDAWFAGSLAPQQHLQLAQMRAVETARPLLRATNTGMTAIVDHKGKIQAAAPPYEIAVLKGKVQPMAGTTPYVRLGNWPVIILSTLALLIPAWGGGHRRRSTTQLL